MQRVARAADVLVQACAILAMFTLALHTVAHAVSRYLFNNPLTGTNEYVTYWYMPVTALLGIYLAQRAGEQIEAGLIFDRLPRPNQTELQVASLLLTGVVAAAFAYHGFRAATEAMELGLTGGMIAVPVWPTMFAVPLGFALLVARLALDVVRLLHPSSAPDLAGPSTAPRPEAGQHVHG